MTVPSTRTPPHLDHDTPRRVVVVGNGMAGARLVADLRERDPRGEALTVTVLGAEPEPAYNRVLLSGVLAGSTAEAALSLAPVEVLPRCTVRLGVSACRLDLDRRVVLDSSGQQHGYDDLVLATGSRAFLPPLPGLVARGGALVDGAVAFRTLADCRELRRRAGHCSRAVVLGGGLLGVEAARALAGRSVPVTLVHVGGHLMERQLDAAAAAILRRGLERLGVDVRTASSAVQIQTTASGTLHGLVLDGGELLPAELLVLAAGVRPDVTLAATAGLAVGHGVLVDDQLRTSDPAVRALGECAEHDGQVPGLVAPAWEQAEVLSDLLTGTRPAARYTGSRPVTRLKADDLDVLAFGDCLQAPDWLQPGPPGRQSSADSTEEVLQFSDPARGTYKKVLLREDRIVGAVLVGDSRTSGRLLTAFDAGDPVPVDRTSLLFGPRTAGGEGPDPALMPSGALVCTCNRVSKGDIVACWQRGARCVADVALDTRATTGCGTCRDAVGGLLEWLHRIDPPQDDPSPAARPAGAPAPLSGAR